MFKTKRSELYMLNDVSWSVTDDDGKVHVGNVFIILVSFRFTKRFFLPFSRTLLYRIKKGGNSNFPPSFVSSLFCPSGFSVFISWTMSP